MLTCKGVMLSKQNFDGVNAKLAVDHWDSFEKYSGFIRVQD